MSSDMNDVCATGNGSRFDLAPAIDEKQLLRFAEGCLDFSIHDRPKKYLRRCRSRASRPWLCPQTEAVVHAVAAYQRIVEEGMPPPALRH